MCLLFCTTDVCVLHLQGIQEMQCYLSGVEVQVMKKAFHVSYFGGNGKTQLNFLSKQKYEYYIIYYELTETSLFMTSKGLLLLCLLSALAMVF